MRLLFFFALFTCLVKSALASPYGSSSHNEPQVLFAVAEVESTDGSIQATFEFEGTVDGQPTFIKARVIKGLSTSQEHFFGGTTFPWHVHTNPIVEGADCNSALGHLDPYNVTESIICDPGFPAFCQEGDLSGKHGTFNATDDGSIPTFGVSDDYLRFFPVDFSLLGRSVVIHAPNLTRLACGNIISTLDNTAKLVDGKLKATNKQSTFVTAMDLPTAAPVQPAVVVTPFVGTVLTSSLQAIEKKLPYPLPQQAIPISSAVDVKLVEVTTTVSIATGTVTVEQPAAQSVAFSSPFKSPY